MHAAAETRHGKTTHAAAHSAAHAPVKTTAHSAHAAVGCAIKFPELATLISKAKLHWLLFFCNS